MKRVLALLLAVLCLLTVTACRRYLPLEPFPEQPQFPEDVKVGVILIHDERSGYDMVHIEGLSRACSSLKLREENLLFEYNVPEGDSAYDAAVRLRNRGCDIIFSNSYGHQAAMEKAAKEFPDVTFVACTGTGAARSGLKNFKNMFPRTYESRYISGVVAGMKLQELLDRGEISDPHVGYLAAFPYAEVISGYTAFFLGIRSVVPRAHMDVIYTYNWFDPDQDAAVTEQLIDRGCVIIGQHSDSTGSAAAVQAAYEAGKTVFSVGYNVDMLAVAPNGVLTSAQNVWSVLYHTVLDTFLTGGDLPADVTAGAAEGAQTISSLGPLAAKETAEAVDLAWSRIKNGSLQVFDTSRFTCQPGAYYEVDQQGHVLSCKALDTDGDGIPDEGEAIIDGCFAESVLQSAPYFQLRIDGITELH